MKLCAATASAIYFIYFLNFYFSSRSSSFFGEKGSAKEISSHLFLEEKKYSQASRA
jgi:uncharacterized membrane protein